MNKPAQEKCKKVNNQLNMTLTVLTGPWNANSFKNSNTTSLKEKV